MFYFIWRTKINQEGNQAPWTSHRWPHSLNGSSRTGAPSALFTAAPPESRMDAAWSHPVLLLYIPKHSWLPKNSVLLPLLPTSNSGLAIFVYLKNTYSSLRIQLRDFLLQEASLTPCPQKGKQAVVCAVSISCTCLSCCPHHGIFQWSVSKSVFLWACNLPLGEPRT